MMSIFYNMYKQDFKEIISCYKLTCILKVFNRMFIFQSFSYLPFQGPVKLKDPDVMFQYIEYYGLNPNSIPSEPYQVFFGRIVSIFR